DLEPLGFATTLWHRDEPAVIGRTIAVVAAEAEHHGSFGEVQPRPLQLCRRSRSGRVDILAEQHFPAGGIETNKVVTRCAVDELVGHREDLMPRWIDHRR